jgi:branched-subunit amino acid aminotransferase/4-amino-4-deoxychorismate lyase
MKKSVSVQRLSFDEVVDRLLAMKMPFHENYLAMYSSWYGGILMDPRLMMVPVDDHLVHRGEGIFEAFKCVRSNIYALDRHLDRLERSAKGSVLSLPLDRPQLVETIKATVRAAAVPDCLIRIFVSRGPGGFSTNPYECTASQLYIVVTTLKALPAEKAEHGVTLKSSHIPIKKAYFANLKSCNYLPNVLMKKEAEDAGVDYTVSLDEQGFLGEGSTENIGIVTQDREFLVPRFDRILRGTTITRAMELAVSLLSTGDLTRIGEADITAGQAYNASEIMMFGTTFDVAPVVDYDGHTIGEGRPGPLFRKLTALILEDIHGCSEMLTPVKE